MDFTRREFIKSIIGAGACAGLLSSDVAHRMPESKLLASIPSAGEVPFTDEEHVF